jgi:hypothetical protein
MTDSFSRICAVIALLLLAVIAFRPNAQSAAPPVLRTHPEGNPNYKVFEMEPDAQAINDVLTKYWNEGAFQLATPPIVTSNGRDKVLLILTQRY